MEYVTVKIRSQWTIVTRHGLGNKWYCVRTTGVAFGWTPQVASAAAFLDGGRPDYLVRTKREAVAEITQRCKFDADAPVRIYKS